MKGNTYKNIQTINTKEPLPDRVYNVLKKTILEGYFSPGESLPEDQLTESTGASRTPVRAALMRLQADGLVQIEPRKCARVVALNRDEMTNLCEARVIFETAFFERAVKKISRDVFKKYRQRLQQAADQMIAFKGCPEELQNKLAEYLKIDFEFHIRLVAASDNKLWLELYNSILDRFRIYSLLTQKRFPSFYPDAHNEHIAILNFILDEDFSEAKWLLRKHLQNFLVRTLKLYTER